MKIEIDTDNLPWVTVPGKPTLGSFLDYQMQLRSNKEEPFPRDWCWFSEFTIFEIEEDAWDTVYLKADGTPRFGYACKEGEERGVRIGIVPSGKRVRRVDIGTVLTNRARSFLGSSSEYGQLDSQRVIRFFDLGKVLRPLTQT